MAVRTQKPAAPPPPRVIASRGGDIVQGRVPARRADPSSLPKLAPSEVNPYRTTFSYLWHPNKWQFIVTKAKPKGEWIPSLQTRYHVPGASRVRTGGALNLARAAWTAEGFREIAKHHGPGGDYVREFDVVINGKGIITTISLSVWDHLIVNGEVTERKFDNVGFRAWVRDLVASHVIEPPPRYVAIRLVKQKQARIERLMGLPADNAVTRERIAKEQERLKLMAESFAEQFGFNPLDEGAEDEFFGSEVQGSGSMPDQGGEEVIA